MKYLNPRQITYCNIDKWHSKGYLGEGIKVGVVEGGMSNYAKDNIYDGTVEDPFGLCRDSKASENNHMQNVVSVLHEVAPKAAKILLPSGFNSQDPYRKGNFLDGLHYAIDNGVDIITMSLGGSGANSKVRVREEEKALHEHGITLLVAAGNSGDRGVDAHARLPHWIAVGNCRLPSSGKPELHPTSSIGPEVDVCGFGTLKVPVIKSANKYKKVTGTSFASPWVAGIMALWLEAHGNIGNVFEYAEKIPGEGTGIGLVKLPSNVPIKKPKEDKQMAKRKQVELLTPAKIEGGRFLVPARDFVEALGGTAHFYKEGGNKKGAFRVGNKRIEFTAGSKTMEILQD